MGRQDKPWGWIDSTIVALIAVTLLYIAIVSFRSGDVAQGVIGASLIGVGVPVVLAAYRRRPKS